MKTFDANIAKINILNYFNKCGITIEAFVNIIGISDRWFKLVSSLKKDYVFDVETVKKSCNFFGVDFHKFTTTICEPPTNLREILQKKHGKNPEYSKILHDIPSLPFIIDNELIYDSEFNSTTEVEVKAIKKIIRKYYPKIELTNLSRTLQKSEFIECKPHPTKKNTNIYSKK